MVVMARLLWWYDLIYSNSSGVPETDWTKCVDNLQGKCYTVQESARIF